MQTKASPLCSGRTGIPNLAVYKEYLAARLPDGDPHAPSWPHNQTCVNSLPHERRQTEAPGTLDYNYPPYRISNGNEMVRTIACCLAPHGSWLHQRRPRVLHDGSVHLRMCW